MRVAHLTLALLLALAIGLGACGSKDDVAGPLGATGTTGEGVAKLATTTVSDDLASLVPENADIVVYVPSLKDLMVRVRDIVAKVDPDTAEEMVVSKMMEELPVGDLADPSQPLALAMTPSADGGDMTPHLIIAVTDTAAAAERIQGARMPPPLTSGNYVSMLMGRGEPQVKGQTPSIARNLPAGDIAVRVNLAALIGRHGDDLRADMARTFDRAGGQSGGASGFDAAAFFEGFQGTVDTLLDSAEQFDLSVSLQGSSLHLHGLFTAKAGSELDGYEAVGDLAGLAGALPADAQITALFSANMTKIMDWVQPLMDQTFAQMPEDQREAIQAEWKTWMKLYQYIGTNHGMAMSFGDAGIQGVVINEMNDVAKYMEGYEAAMQSEVYAELMSTSGVELEKLPMTAVAGVDVHHYLMAFDIDAMLASNPGLEDAPREAAQAMRQLFEGMFGEGGMRIHIAAVGQKMVTVMGGDDAYLEKAIAGASSGAAAGALGDAIQVAGGKPVFLFRLEARSLVGRILGMAREVMGEEGDEIPTLADGAAVPIVIYASAEGRSYAGGMKLDASAMIDMIQELMDE